MFQKVVCTQKNTTFLKRNKMVLIHFNLNVNILSSLADNTIIEIIS